MLFGPGGPIRLDERGQVGLNGEAHDDDAQGDHDAATDVLLGLAGFLGQRGNAVEAQEVQRSNGDASSDEGGGDYLRLPDRIHIELAGTAAAHDEVAAQSHKRNHGHDLNRENDEVYAARHGNAADVHERVERHEHDDPQPPRAARNQHDAPVCDHGVKQCGGDAVIQQDHPAGHKAHMGVQAALHVRVYRACNGETLAHAHVAQCREADGHEANEVHQGGHAQTLLLHQAPDRMRGDDDHKQHTVQNDVPQTEAAMQLLLVAELLKRSVRALGGSLVFRH